MALKQAQGQLVAELFIDNLMRWKTYVGEVILDWIGKYETGKRTMKVSGESLDPKMKELLQQQGLFQPSTRDDGQGYVSMNVEGNQSSYLKDAKFELLVTEGELTESDRNQKLAQLAAYQQITGAPVPPEVLLQYMPMDFSLKTKLIQAFQQQQQMAQQQQAKEDNLEQQKVDVKKAQVLTHVPR